MLVLLCSLLSPIWPYCHYRQLHVDLSSSWFPAVKSTYRPPAIHASVCLQCVMCRWNGCISEIVTETHWTKAELMGMCSIWACRVERPCVCVVLPLYVYKSCLSCFSNVSQYEIALWDTSMMPLLRQCVSTKVGGCRSLSLWCLLQKSLLHAGFAAYKQFCVCL